MIDHVSVGATDLERATRFYEAALGALGLLRLVTRPATIGFGKSYPEFWINLREGMAKVPHDAGTHICLRAKTTAEVDAFMLRQSAPVGHQTARRACDPMTVSNIMRPLCLIPTAIASRR